jgi:hypothetical protein
VALGVLALGLYGVVASFQPDANFGRVLAAYGGVFIVGSLAWGMAFDGFRPDRFDLAGAAICLVGGRGDHVRTQKRDLAAFQCKAQHCASRPKRLEISCARRATASRTPPLTAETTSSRFLAAKAATGVLSRSRGPRRGHRR